MGLDDDQSLWLLELVLHVCDNLHGRPAIPAWHPGDSSWCIQTNVVRPKKEE